MKYIIAIALVISCTVFCMDTKNQVRQQLRNILSHGNYKEFENNQSAFQKELDYQDIDCAHHICQNRLAMVEDLKAMYTNMRIDLLVALMKIEIKKENLSLLDTFYYIQEKYQLNEPFDEELLGIANHIVGAIIWHSSHPMQQHIIDLQTKLAREKRPVQLLEAERQNAIKIRNDLQHILASRCPHDSTQFDESYGRYWGLYA